MRQSDKQGTIKLTKPVSPQPITSIQQVQEDASLWPVIDGVKQKNGFAYCDGSTLDNTSGKYDNFNTANGSLVLPNGPYRTVELTENEVTVTNNKSMNYEMGRFIAYSDSLGKWRLRGNIGIMRTDDITDLNITISIAGVLFDANTIEQTCSADILNDVGNGVSNALNVVRVQDNSGNIFIAKDGTGFNRVKLSFDVALESKPTWADANLESYPVISLHDNIAAGALGLPEATATQAGVVQYEEFVEPNATVMGTSNITTAKISGIRVGNQVTLNLILDVTIDAEAVNPLIIGEGQIPESMRPSNTFRQIMVPFNIAGTRRITMAYVTHNTGSILIWSDINASSISANQSVISGFNGRYVTLSYNIIEP